MTRPILRFVVDPELDASLAWLFYSDPNYGGIDFWNKGAIPYHEELKKLGLKKNKKSFLNTYVLKLYRDNHKSIHKRGEEIKQLYETNKSVFFTQTERLFQGHDLKGRYTAYFSIFDFCPRFLDKKSFFVFLSQHDKDVLFTIFHELLHFYFYRYCLSVYPESFKSLNTEQGVFWEIAELFNGVIMQTPEFLKLYDMQPSFGYPELNSAFKQAKRSWNGQLDQWMNLFALPYIKAKTPR